LRARKTAAALSLQAEQASTDQIALDLQTLLVESWVIHHAAVLQEKILTQQRQTNIQFLALTELRLAQGQGNALDVLQQRGRLVTSQRSLPEVTSRKRRAANAYAVLLGQFPDNGVLAATQWPHLERLTVLSSPRQLLVDRPDLRAAFLALQAADQEVAAAIADRMPRLSIGLIYAESGRHLASMGNNTILRAAGGLLAPVFDAGRLKAAAAQRKAEANERLALVEQAMLTAVQEVQDALTRENALFDEQQLLDKETAIAQDTVDKAKLRYVNGEENFLAVLVALAKLQTLQLSKVSLQQELLINRGRLLKALGAKWQMESS
jgi:outer membrane protein TolC